MQAHAPHQSLHGAAGDAKAFAQQLPPDLANTVDPEVLLEDPTNFDLQCGVASRADRQPGGIDPDIAEAILDGRQPPTMQLQPLIRKGVPVEWERQLAFFEAG